MFPIRSNLSSAVALVLFFAATLAQGAPDTSQTTAPSLSSVLESSGLTLNGYVAASYYHSNGYNTFHQFDVRHDTFQLDQAAMTLAYQPKDGFGALVNVVAGEDMKILHSAEDGNSQRFDLVQGFVQYATGPVTVIAGKYLTLAGAEVIAPTGNTNFSRSFLFYAEPLTHTGIRATWAATDTLNLIVGVNNGWNTTSTSYGSKTAELGVGWTRSKAFAFTIQGYSGKEPAYDAQRTLIDAVATYNATEALSFVLSYDWGRQKQVEESNLSWNGVAGYVNYAFNEQWRISVRGEYLDDRDGFVSGTDQKLKEGTLTLGFSPIKAFELRLEGRFDRASQPTLIRSVADGAPSTLAQNQTGFALQGLFKF